MGIIVNTIGINVPFQPFVSGTQVAVSASYSTSEGLVIDGYAVQVDATNVSGFPTTTGAYAVGQFYGAHIYYDLVTNAFGMIATPISYATAQLAAAAIAATPLTGKKYAIADVTGQVSTVTNIPTITFAAIPSSSSGTTNYTEYVQNGASFTSTFTATYPNIHNPNFGAAMDANFIYDLPQSFQPIIKVSRTSLSVVASSSTFFGNDAAGMTIVGSELIVFDLGFFGNLQVYHYLTADMSTGASDFSAAITWSLYGNGAGGTYDATRNLYYLAVSGGSVTTGGTIWIIAVDPAALTLVGSAFNTGISNDGFGTSLNYDGVNQRLWYTDASGLHHAIAVSGGGTPSYANQASLNFTGPFGFGETALYAVQLQQIATASNVTVTDKRPILDHTSALEHLTYDLNNGIDPDIPNLYVSGNYTHTNSTLVYNNVTITGNLTLNAIITIKGSLTVGGQLLCALNLFNNTAQAVVTIGGNVTLTGGANMNFTSNANNGFFIGGTLYARANVVMQNASIPSSAASSGSFLEVMGDIILTTPIFNLQAQNPVGYALDLSGFTSSGSTSANGMHLFVGGSFNGGYIKTSGFPGSSASIGGYGGDIVIMGDITCVGSTGTSSILLSGGSYPGSSSNRAGGASGYCYIEGNGSLSSGITTRGGSGGGNQGGGRGGNVFVGGQLECGNIVTSGGFTSTSATGTPMPGVNGQLTLQANVVCQQIVTGGAPPSGFLAGEQYVSFNSPITGGIFTCAGNLKCVSMQSNGCDVTAVGSQAGSSGLVIISGNCIVGNMTYKGGQASQYFGGYLNNLTFGGDLIVTGTMLIQGGNSTSTGSNVGGGGGAGNINQGDGRTVNSAPTFKVQGDLTATLSTALHLLIGGNASTTTTSSASAGGNSPGLEVFGRTLIDGSIDIRGGNGRDAGLSVGRVGLLRLHSGGRINKITTAVTLGLADSSTEYFRFGGFLTIGSFVLNAAYTNKKVATFELFVGETAMVSMPSGSGSIIGAGAGQFPTASIATGKLMLGTCSVIASITTPFGGGTTTWLTSTFS